ncbi:MULTISPECIES: amino acid ABC transporter permease [Thioclava]|uniref:Amino acid ABC transporter permease n=1 Tax=Thioclava kandeliae TaxID=3070818 RepID=A0ABV1SHM6_9RHOB
MTVFDPEAFFGYLVNSFLIGGVGVTIALTVASVIGGLILGTAIAMARMSPQRLISLPARAYIWFFRGTPLLIQLVVIYTGLPQLGLKLDVITCALVGLILHEAAYMAEIVRSGFMSVPKGQTEAGWSLNLSPFTIFWRVTLPQAFRLMVPPLGNSINSLLKATSLASVISVEEIMRRSDELMQQDFQTLEVYAAAACYYLLLTTLWDLAQRRIEAHFARSFTQTAARKPNPKAA